MKLFKFTRTVPKLYVEYDTVTYPTNEYTKDSILYNASTFSTYTQELRTYEIRCNTDARVNDKLWRKKKITEIIRAMMFKYTLKNYLLADGRKIDF